MPVELRGTTPDSLRARSVHTCTRNDAVQATLANAGASLLEITLVVGPNDEKAPEPEVRSEFFQLVKPVLDRITFSCRIVNPRMTLDLLKRSLANVFVDGNLKNLESLMIASAYPIGSLYELLKEMLDVVDKSSDKLQSVYLENVNRDFIVSISELGFWSRLVRITVRHEFDAVDVSCFTACTALEFLSYSGELAYAETNFKRKFEYPLLKWLKVGAITMNALSMLKLPMLHTLVIDSVRNENLETPPPPHSIIIAQLKVLHLLTVMPTAAAIRAPNFETFHLSIQTVKQTDADNVLRAIFDGQEDMLQPEHLSLKAPVHDKDILDMLERLPNLISLSLDRQAQYSKSFFRELTPPTRHPRSFFGAGSVKPIKPVLVPKLRSLTMDMQRLTPAAGVVSLIPDGNRSLITTLIRHRKEANTCVALLRVACRWKPHEPSEEFVHPTMCLTCIEAHIQTEAHNTRAVDPNEHAQVAH